MEQATTKVSCSKTLFLVNCVHKQCSQCSTSCIETLVILRAKFHVVSSLNSVLKIKIYFDAIIKVPVALPKRPENENTVNLKCASFVRFGQVFRFKSFTVRVTATVVRKNSKTGNL